MDHHRYHINDILDNNRLFQVGSVKLLVVLVTDQTCINQSRLQKKKNLVPQCCHFALCTPEICTSTTSLWFYSLIILDFHLHYKPCCCILSGSNTFFNSNFENKIVKK